MENSITGQPFSGIGFHWREDDDVLPLIPQELSDTRGFYVCDDPYSWGSPHLIGTHAVEVTYHVNNPYVDIDNSVIYEHHYCDERINKIRKRGHDAIVYISNVHSDTEASRQIFLLNPSVQISKIKPLTQTSVLTKPRMVEGVYIPDAETDDRYPLSIGTDAVQIGEDVAFSNYDVYFEQNGNLLYKPIREVMRKGQTAKEFFYEAGKLNFRNALNFLHLSQYGKNAGDLHFADGWFDILRNHLIDAESVVESVDKGVYMTKKVFDCSSNIEQAIDACNVMDKAIYDIAGFDDPNAHIPNLVSAAYGHPSQPVYTDAGGVKRFKPNKIISDLSDAGKLDLNHIAANYSDEDKCQFNQLIGYSVDGWWDLSSTNMVAYSKARVEEIRHEQNSVLDGEINYIRKGDNIVPMIGINVTMDGGMYDIPLALPILLQRMNNYDGHYNLRRNDSVDEGYEVEWVDSSFHGHCSYDQDVASSNDGIPEFPVHDINMKIYKDFIWLEEIADPSSGNKVLTFDWKAMTAAFLPTDGSEVNLGISKLLTRYFTYTKDNVDLQGVYMLSQSALRFYDARERVLKLLDNPEFNAELYLDVDFTGLVEALLIGPVKNNTSVNQMMMVKKTKGAAKQIQSLLNQMNQSMVIFESGKIHLETDHAKYDADIGELETLIKQYL